MAKNMVLPHLCHFLYYPNIFFNITLPIFLSSPFREVGIPVFLLKVCFALVIPKALFSEKEIPGILNDDLFPISLSIFNNIFCSTCIAGLRRFYNLLL